MRRKAVNLLAGMVIVGLLGYIGYSPATWEFWAILGLLALMTGNSEV